MGFYATSYLVEEETPLRNRIVGSERFSSDRAEFLASQPPEPHQETTLIVTIYASGLKRFWTVDEFEGVEGAPLSLHRYLYCNQNPISFIDPSGQFTLMETLITVSIVGLLAIDTGIVLGVVHAKQGVSETYEECQQRVRPYFENLLEVTAFLGAGSGVLAATGKIMNQIGGNAVTDAAMELSAAARHAGLDAGTAPKKGVFDLSYRALASVKGATIAGGLKAFETAVTVGSRLTGPAFVISTSVHWITLASIDAYCHTLVSSQKP